MDNVIKIEQGNIPHCPVCNHSLDCHKASGHNCLPMTGDVSICVNCISVLVYEIDKSTIGLRLPTEEEQKVFDSDEKISKIIEDMKLIKNKADGSN